MADRFPLILNTSTNQIQEIASGDQLNLSGNNIANAGIITAGNVTIGAATTDLIVTGDARVTGILTVGTGSLTLDGPNNLVNVGTALTLGHTQGLQFHTQNLHSAGFEVNQINASGIITATEADINGDIDVDGHTNLDNVSVAGVSTFAGNADFSAGIDVTGNLIASGNLTANNGTITVSGTAPKITFTETNDNPDYKLEANGGNIAFVDTTNSATRLSISSSGINVTGNGTFSGNVSVGGVLTYEDVTNVDSVGIITARQGVRLGVDGTSSSNYISVGVGNDLKIWHQSSNNHSYISETGSGSLIVLADDFYVQDTSTNTMISAKEGAEVNLHFNGGTPKLSTTNTGVSIPLDLDVDGHTNLDNVNVSGVCTVSSNIYTNGRLEIASSQPRIHLVDTDNNDDFSIYNNHGNFLIYDSTDGADRFKIDSSGNITMPGDTTFSGGSGAITIASGGDIRMAAGNWTGESGGKIQYHGDYMYFQVGDTDTSAGWQFRDSTGAATLELKADGTTVGKTISFGQDCQFTGGASAVNIAGGSDIRLSSGGWTGNAYGKIQHHADCLYIGGGSQSTYSIIFRYDGNDKIYMKSDGTWYPASNNASDLGTTSNRWRNLYTTDLQLSNEGKTNDVDGTWGDYTIQEGESDLFLINNRSGKKYKFNLTEVS